MIDMVDKMSNRVAVTTLKHIKYNIEKAREKDDSIDIFGCDRKALDMAIKALGQTRWIPVSERLPKDDEDVLVCDSQGAMEVCYYHIDDNVYPTEFADLNETGWYDEHENALYFEPIAWMPLPQQPYKAESEDEE